MSKLSDKIAIPADGAINGGLSPCGSSLLKIFGMPGALTKNCSPVTNTKLKRKIVTADVGPFRVTGLAPAVASLTRIFERVRTDKPQVYEEVRTAGMLCCRAIRGSVSSYSIHSWGCAIDLYFGDGVVPLGQPLTHRGILELYPYFQNEGWYWGAEFGRADAMHFETAAETVARWQKDGLL